MPFGIDDAATVMNMAAPLVGMGISELTHPQQLRHQQDFMNQQIEGQKKLASYNQALAIDTWNKTNYEQQVKHMENAGLNPGLLYGKGGGGGATTNFGGGGNVTSGTAPNASANTGMALQMASQMRLLNAQAENIETDTELKKKQAVKTETEVPKVQAETENTRTQTEYTKSQTAINEFNKKIAEVESDIALANKSNRIGMLNEEYNNLVAHTKLTQSEKDLVDKQLIETTTKIALMESNIAVNHKDLQLKSAQINEIAQDLQIRWKQLATNQYNSETERIKARTDFMEYGLKLIETKFKTNVVGRSQQVMNLFSTMMSTLTGGVSSATKVAGL